MYRKIITIFIMLSLLIGSWEASYALRPMAESDSSRLAATLLFQRSADGNSLLELRKIKVNNAKLSLLSDEGQFVDTYNVEGYDDVVIKIVKPNALNILGEKVSFEKDIKPGVELAQSRLGSLTVSTEIITNFYVFINGKRTFVQEAVIQYKVIPILLHMRALISNGDIKQAKALVHEWIMLQERMWKRGVLDQDIKISNYGIDLKTVGYDFSCFSTDKATRDILTDGTNVIDFLRIANVSMLNVIHPELGEAYMLSEFNIIRFNKSWVKFVAIREDRPSNVSPAKQITVQSFKVGIAIDFAA